ncbi:piRNA biogenesis protein EXD1 isoform X1 [Nothoprocta perdicaria]|uniref:piRNA biogenesis protein EXD1 isoform X1 n=1 Tax=Nothoprocta perdicaria TaxID=30464 RepID=UPI000E1BD7F0|nr:piRNA biogenesis protein EXD1 isoform X1 [Nothoprocta perdicaria]
MALGNECFGALLGRTVKITLTCGAFQGVLQRVNADRSLVLRAVKNLDTGRSTPGAKMFFGREIVNVELLDEPGSGKGTATLSECASALEGNTEAETGGWACCDPWSSPCISLESQLRAWNSLKSCLSGKEGEENVDYTVVDCFQQKFGSAVLHLKQQSVVSVVAEGVHLCRHGRLAWLQIATKSQIFLFDIFLLGPRAFKNGLQMVLEDRSILKVMHDCRWISDCLSHQYGVHLSNVFDTQVADVLQFSMATGGFLPHCICTLPECLMQHVAVSSRSAALMKGREQMAWDNPDIWFLRPCPPSLLKTLALKAMYLLQLRSSLMDKLMSDLTALVDDYINAFRNKSGDCLGSTKPTCMELPEELLQLTDLQKLRRKKAMEDYKINENGLLIRPAMKLKEKKDMQKDGSHREVGDYLLTNREPCQTTSYYDPDQFCQGKHENQNHDD